MSDSNPRNEPADSADDAQRALQAVQVALDRRDNGGSAGAQRAGTPDKTTKSSIRPRDRDPSACNKHCWPEPPTTN